LGDEFISGFRLPSIELATPQNPIRNGRGRGPRCSVIRKATIQRFPYVIAFEKHEQHVLVLAVAHAKRRPLYWLRRVNP
jgi:hypothetical protein